MMDFTETCQAAVNHFGYQSQSMMAIEELAELSIEMCKYFQGDNNVIQIAEEIADVQIMLEQLIILHDCREAVANHVPEAMFRYDSAVLSVLQKELCKHFRGKSNCTKLVKAIAEVKVMLATMIDAFSCEDLVEDWKFAKLMRLKELMGDGKNS